MKIPVKLIFTGSPSAGKDRLLPIREKRVRRGFLQASGDDSECGFVSMSFLVCGYKNTNYCFIWSICTD